MQHLQEAIGPCKGQEIAIAPPVVALRDTGASFTLPGYRLAAQDCFWRKSGAFTGEISAEMLKDVGCEYVIVGHSERRQERGETDKAVGLKVLNAVEQGLKPILCVGESLEARTQNSANQVVGIQIESALSGISVQVASSIVIAYEPIWAIGTGHCAAPDEVQNMHAHLRASLSKLFGTDISEEIRVLYGGSVNSSNVAEFMKQRDVDGVLVGSASLNVTSFAEIIARCI